MEKQVIQKVKSLFHNTDERDWKKVQSLMADKVLIDFTAMNGAHAEDQRPEQIVGSWMSVLPGYDKTQHQVSDFEVTEDGHLAKVHYRGKADHFLGNDVFTVEATYDTELIHSNNGWLITKHRLSRPQLSGNKSLPDKASEKVKEKTIRKIEFISDGLILKGNLHVPVDFDEHLSYKGIVVTGSWTTVKEQMPDLYAGKLAKEGFVALSFDFRNYGESEGKQRNMEELPLKSRDITNAVNYLKTLSFIDGKNIGGFAICASSGAMAMAIANGADIKVVNFIAPWLHNPELVKPLYGGAKAVADKIKKSDKAKALFEETGEIEYVPAVSKTNKEAAMFGDFPYYLDSKRGAIPEWGDLFAVMAWRGWLEFNAIQFADKIKIPIQLIHSEQAAVPQGAKLFFENLHTEKNIIWKEGISQFEFYDQEPVTTYAVSDAVSWFNKYFNDEKWNKGNC